MDTLLTNEEINFLLNLYSQSMKVGSTSDNSSDLSRLFREVLDNPGSLIRAKICFITMRARGLSKEASGNIAIALEYFHLASLLLDDLPSMDNAEVRRGSPCIHKIYGEANTILASLGLINRAYVLFWSVIANFPQDKRDAASHLLEDCLGVNGLVMGQFLDLSYSKQLHSKENVTNIADKKTGTLFRLAFVLPAIASNAGKTEIHLLNRLAKFFGRTYQILDDFKDVYNLELDSKKTSRDILLGRPNIVVNLGIKSAKIYLQKLLDISEVTISSIENIAPELTLYRKLWSEFNLVKEDCLKLKSNSCADASV